MMEILTDMRTKKISKYFNNGRSGLVSVEGLKPPLLVKNMKKNVQMDILGEDN